MLNSVTWKEFFEFVIFITTAYYVTIVWLYYKPDIMQFIDKKRLIGDSTVASLYQSTPSARSNTDNATDNNNPINSLFDELIEKLTKVIGKAAKNNFQKVELVFALQLIIKDYVQLRSTNFEAPINNYIQTEVENQFSIHLSADELQLLWQV